MTSVETINAIHKAVWDFRAEYNFAWPTPNQFDSIRFAFTEIAEVVDAELRGNTTYRRNHARNREIDYEMADCAIMLITALPTSEGISTGAFSNMIERIALEIAKAMYLWEQSPDLALKHVRHALESIMAFYDGDELERLIWLRLNRIYQKHVAKPLWRHRLEE